MALIAMHRLLFLVLAIPAIAQPPDLAARTKAHKSPPIDAGHPELVSFASGSLTLHGYLYKPSGAGPFPAVIWNHGSEKLPGSQPELGGFYTSHGFVFFAPHRHGHGRSPGEYISDVLDAYAKTHSAHEQGRELVRLQELYNLDVEAAVAWIKTQPFVDANRLIVSGVSYGGIQTLLAAEKGLGVRGFIPFAPGAKSWASTELQDRLKRAVEKAKAPVFLLQARNDWGLGPSEVLGPLIRRRGAPNDARVYPKFGTSADQGHYAFATWDVGTEVWGADVLAFIAAVTK
jgi:dienelactone hydrolase